MDQTQQTEQTSSEALDPQLADVGTTGEATPYDAIPTSELGMPETESVEPVYGVLVIPPTVGRKVHFYPNGANFHSTPYCIDPTVPMDADVVFVWHDRMVNLTVKDHIGQVHAFTSITLRQPDEPAPQGPYAEWMPFQAAQARAAA